MRKRIKIFSDKKYLRVDKRHQLMLFPFWGEYPENPNLPFFGVFDNYIANGSKYFELTSLEECDFAVLPSEWDPSNALLYEFGKMANKSGIRSLCFYGSDSIDKCLLENTIVFRTSLTATSRSQNEVALPGWHEDFIEKYRSGELLLREKKKRPVVGFCGNEGSNQFFERLKCYVRLSVIIRIRDKIKPDQCGKVAPFRGLEPKASRRKALTALEGAGHIDTNFIYRKEFFASAFSGNISVYDLMKARYDYVDNIISSDYTICVRGTGNFSYRLYETLCCGRIPIFINTDCVLPYESELDWKTFSVWVEEKDMHRLPEILMDFHSALSPDDFMEMQTKCRHIWCEWLSPDGFYKNLYRHFQ